MKQESLSILMSKLIMVVSLIVGIGAVCGVMGYYLSEQKDNIDIAKNLNTNEQKSEDSELTKEIIQKYNYKKLPQFQEFPTSNTRIDFVVPIDFSKNEKAVEFKAVLNKGIESGSNFASQYAVVSWGCGTECQAIAIVNAKNGDVYFSPFSAFSYGVDFKLNSSLIIINPISNIKEVHEDEIPSWLKTYYYNWNGNELELIYKLDYKKESLADWKTYQNEEYGFEVKYPNDWEEINKTPAIMSFVNRDNENNIIQIRNEDRENDISLMEQIKGNGNIEPELIKINNKDFYFLKISMAGLVFYEYYTEDKNKIFTISMMNMSADLSENAQDESDITYPTDKELSKELNILRIILSTFKFIENLKTQE